MSDPICYTLLTSLTPFASIPTALLTRAEQLSSESCYWGKGRLTSTILLHYSIQVQMRRHNLAPNLAAEPL